MPAPTPYRHFRPEKVPREKWSGRFGLPRRIEPKVELTGWQKLKSLIRHRKLFWKAGWEAVAAGRESMIRDADYEPRLRASLGEYLNWYFGDKRFLHSIDWMGVPTRKLVTDIWVYQEIVWETKPDIIIEIGSLCGGSTLFLAQLQEMIGDGEVLSLDINRDWFTAEHPRIRTITGDCSAPEILEQVRQAIAGKTVMVIHDGDHSAQAVERDLLLYAELVTPGMYLVIEDGVVDLLNPKYSKLATGYPDGGPLEATRRLRERLEEWFELDMRRERFVLTTNPQGYWKRKEQN